MKKLLTALFLIVFAAGLLFIKLSPTLVKADTGAPVTITATYNSSTGQLNASGSYAWEECEPGEETNILGFALFINGGTPAINDSNALDGSSMHLANSGNPCTTTPDNWVDNNHVLSSAPANVCVVVYDVRVDDSADPGGIHSLIGAGGDYNTDNSWNFNGSSYLEGACTAPEVITPTETPTPAPTPTPTPTLSLSNGPIGGSNGGGSTQCTDAKPGIPGLLSVNKNSSSTAVLAWSLVSSATDYSILYGLSSGNYIYGVPRTGNTDHYTVGSLNPGVNYYFAVKAVNGCTPGDPSNERSTGSDRGQVLGASTMAATGIADQLVMVTVLVMGVLITVRSGYAYAKAK